jgi:hypothetical protein
VILDNINLDEFNMLVAPACYNQSLNTVDPQESLIIPPESHSSIVPVTSNTIDMPMSMEFTPMSALTMSETPVHDFIAPNSLKLPSGFPESQLPRINTKSFGITNDSFVSF